MSERGGADGRRSGREIGYRTSTVLAACGVLLASAACTRSVQLTEAHGSAIRDSVSAFLEDFQRHSANAQWDSLGALYADTPEFRFLESGEIRYRTVAAIRDALRGLPAGTRIETRYEDLSILPLAPGVAAVSGRFETRFVDAAGAGFQFGGALSLVVRREAAAWRIVTGHSSAPVPRGG